MNETDEVGTTPLMHVITGGGNEQLCKALLGHGALVDFQDQRGSTALHLAVIRNQQTVARLLIEAGASPELRSNSGQSPISLAIESDEMYYDVPEPTDQVGLEVTDSNGKTLLSSVVDLYQSIMVELLLRRRASPGFIESQGNSLLHAAVHRYCDRFGRNPYDGAEYIIRELL